MITKLITTSTRSLISRSCSSSVKEQNLWRPDLVVKSPRRDIEVTNLTITEHVFKNMERWADKTALICGITKQRYTYYQLYKYSQNLAVNLIEKFKISNGDLIGVMATNSPDFTVSLLGSLKSGATVCSLNPMGSAYELHKQLNNNKPKAVITQIEILPVMKDTLKLLQLDIPIIVIKTATETLPEGTIAFEEIIQGGINLDVLKTVRSKAEDVAMLLFSSGTTGQSKAVEITNRNIVVNCIQQDVEGVKQYNDTTGSYQDSVMSILPSYHIYGMAVVLLHKLSIGAKVVSLPKFNPKTFLIAMKEEKTNLMYLVPPLVSFLASDPQVKMEHLQSVDRFINGAAQATNQDIHKILEKGKPSSRFITAYGLTESCMVSCIEAGSTNYESVGFGLSNTELKIVDSDLNALGPNEVGELLIRGPQIMKGYRNNAKATKETLSEDGWLRSGDLASINTDGSLVIVDRLKDLIKVKGFQVAPAELENVLKEHPAVLDAAVVGISDPRAGEVPRAFVVLKDGQKADVNDISNFVKERVTEYKQLKDVIILNSLPKSPAGKTLKKVLKEEHC